jgi:hypothetical protein
MCFTTVPFQIFSFVLSLFLKLFFWKKTIPSTVVAVGGEGTEIDGFNDTRRRASIHGVVKIIPSSSQLRKL